MPKLIGQVLAAVVLILAASLIGLAVWDLFTSMSAQLAVALGTAMATVSVAVWTFIKTKEKDIEARQFSARADVYKSILETLRNITVSQAPGTEKPTMEENVAKLQAAKFDLIIWGSIKSIRALNAISFSSGNIHELYTKTAYLFGSMREDLGHKVYVEYCVDMFVSIIRSDEQAEVVENTKNTEYYKNRLSKDFPARSN